MAEKPSSEAPKQEKTDTDGGKLESSALETLAIPDSSSHSADDTAGESRSFSQLLAGAMASPAGSGIIAVPVDAVRVSMVAVPCFIAPATLLDSSRFRGQFAMTHQAVLATVTAQAQIQLQAAHCSSSSDLLTNFVSQPMLSTLSPLPLQQRPPPLSEGNTCTPESEEPPSSDHKPQSARIIVKTATGDGYNWRKYGQKQVKSSERSRSYYKCTNANCFAKKKVESCQDGRVTEIIYRGQHNHGATQKTRCSKGRGSQSCGPLAENENFDLTSVEHNESDHSTSSKTEQNSGSGTPEQQLPAQQLHCSSDCEGDAGIKIEEDLGDEPDPKRRLSESTMPCSAPLLKTVREPKIVVQTASNTGLISDGYRWRKYGQKIVKGNPNPRSYYRCTHIGCPVRKHVERASEDEKAIVITYEGKHNHDLPPPKNSGEPPANALLIAAAAAETTEGRLIQNCDKKTSTECPPVVDGEISGEKALELGGEKALESAQTLLSIGFNSTPGDEGGGNSSDGIQRPLFNENHAAVPVQNS